MTLIDGCLGTPTAEPEVQAGPSSEEGEDQQQQQVQGQDQQEEEEQEPTQPASTRQHTPETWPATQGQSILQSMYVYMILTNA